MKTPTLAVLIITVLALFVCSSSRIFGQTLNAFTDSEKQAIVNLHNDYRFQVLNPGAVDMATIVWDETLAQVAADYTDKCTFAHNTARPVGTGENIYVGVIGTTFGIDAVNSWGAEKANYNYNTGCASGATCGHYTQVINANTTKVGCAMKKCSSWTGLDASFNGATYVICNYSPEYVSGVPYTAKVYLTRAEAAAHRAELMNGVTQIPTKTPSYFYSHGSNSIPLFSTSGKVIAMGGSYYGKARVCAFSAEGYVRDEDNVNDLMKLQRNCIKWTTQGKSTIKYFLHGVDNIPAYKDYAGMTLVPGSNVFDDATPLDSIDLLVISLQNINIVSEAQKTKMKKFLLRGGAMICGVTQWYHGIRIFPDSFLGNILFNDIGITFFPWWVNTVPISVLSDSDPDGYNMYWSFDTMYTSGLLPLDKLTDLRAAARWIVRCTPAGSAKYFQIVPKINDVYNKYCASVATNIKVGAKITSDEYKKCIYIIEIANLFDVLPMDDKNLQLTFARNFPGDALNGDNYKNASVVTASVTISANRTRWQCSGYYVVPGGKVSITVSNPDQIDDIIIGGNTDDNTPHPTWLRWPFLSATKWLNYETNSTGTFTAVSGGIIYFDLLNPVTFNATITGQIVKVPFFRHDVNKNEDWQVLKTYQSPLIELEGLHYIICVRNTNFARNNLTDVQALLKYWGEDVMPLMYELAGVEPRPYKERWHTDTDIIVGYMHSGYPQYTFIGEQDEIILTVNNHISMPPASNVNPRFGHYHELGHNYQSTYWTPKGTAEITCNLYALWGEEHYPGGFGLYGGYNYIAPDRENSEIELMLNQNEFLGDWSKAGMLFQMDLIKGFGWVTLKKFIASYYNTSIALPVTEQDKFDQWLTRYTDLTERNLVPFFDRFRYPLSQSARDYALSKNYTRWMPDEFVIDCSKVVIAGSPCMSLELGNGLNGTLTTYYVDIVMWSPIRPYNGDYLLISFYGSTPTFSSLNMTLNVTEGPIANFALVEYSRYKTTLRISTTAYAPAGAKISLSFVANNSYFIGEMKTSIKHATGKDVLINLMERPLEFSQTIEQSTVSGVRVCLPGYSGDNCETHSCFGVVATSPLVCNGMGVCASLDNCTCNSSVYFGPKCTDTTIMSRQDVQNHRQVLLDGVTRIYSDYSSYFIVHGPNAFPVIKSSQSGKEVYVTVAAASYNGKGRVVAFGQDNYVASQLTDKKYDFDRFMNNVIGWVTKDKPKITYMIHGISFDYFKTNNKMTRYLKTKNAFNVDVKPLNQVDLLIISFSTVSKADENMRAIMRDFLERGGAIIVGSNAWWTPFSTSTDPSVYPGNVFFADIGISWVSSYPNGDFYSAINDTLSDTNVYWKLDDIERNFISSFTDTDHTNIFKTISTIKPTLVQPMTLANTQILAKMSSLYNSNCSSLSLFPSDSPMKRFCVNIATTLNSFDYLPIEGNPQVLAAEIYPGVALNGDNSRTGTTLTVSVSISSSKTKYHCSGYYALPGTSLTISVTNPSGIDTIAVGGNTDDLSASYTTVWARWPVLVKNVTLNGNTTVTFTAINGGIIYFNLISPATFTATITGKIVKVPYFKKGVHSNQDWETNRNNQAPLMEIEGDNIVFVLRATSVNRQVTDIESVVNYWDNVVTTFYELTNRTASYKDRVISDLQAPDTDFYHSGYPCAVSVNLDEKILIALPNSTVQQVTTNLTRTAMFDLIADNFIDRPNFFSQALYSFKKIISLYAYEDYPTGTKLYGDNNYNPPNKEGQSVMSSSMPFKSNWLLASPLFCLELIKAFGWVSMKKFLRTFTFNGSAFTVEADRRNVWLLRYSAIVGRNLVPLFTRYNFQYDYNTDSKNVAKLPYWTPESYIMDCNSVLVSGSPCASLTLNNNAALKETLYSLKLVTWSSIRPYNGDKLIISFSGSVPVVSKQNGAYTATVQGNAQPVDVHSYSNVTEIHYSPSNFIRYGESLYFTFTATNGKEGNMTATIRHVDGYGNLINVVERPLEFKSTITAYQTDECGNQCGDNGACTLVSGMYSCVCKEGWSGSLCNIPKCNGKTENEGGCSLKGTCNADHTCTCKGNFDTSTFCSTCLSGYSGEDCSTPVCFGISADKASTVCSGKGTCTGVNVCACLDGYSGRDCSNFTCYNIDRNSSTVCSGRGSCISPDTCACPERYNDKKNCSSCSPSYRGENCETPFCDDKTTCSGNGVCSGINCICNAGFNGTNCDSCVEGLFGPKCDMKCTSSLNCSSRGECAKDGSCVCSGNFAGKNCLECVAGYSGDKCDFKIFPETFVFSTNGDSISGKVQSSINKVISCGDIIKSDLSAVGGAEAKCTLNGNKNSLEIILGTSATIVDGSKITLSVLGTNSTVSVTIGLGLFTPSAPTATLVADKSSVSTCDTVSLDASGSSTLDRRALSFSWEVSSAPNAGSKSTLNDLIKNTTTSGISLTSETLSKLSEGRYTILVKVTSSFSKVSTAGTDFTIVSQPVPTVSLKEGIASSFLIGSISTITPTIKFPTCYNGDYKTTYAYTVDASTPSASTISNIVSKDGLLILGKTGTNLNVVGDYHFIVTATASGVQSSLKFTVTTLAQPLSISFNVSDMTQSTHTYLSFRVSENDPSATEESQSIEITCSNTLLGTSCPQPPLNQKSYGTYLSAGEYKYTAKFTKGSRSATKSLIVKVLDVEASSLIRASITSDQDLTLVNPSKDLYLTYTSLEQLSAPTFVWSSTSISLDSIDVKSSIIKIPMSLLTAGSSFQVKLQIKDGERSGVAEKTISTNSPPTKGVLEIYPETGIALSTTFDIKCSNGWTDPQTPLTFEFKYLDESMDKWITLSERTEVKAVKVNLPVGFGANSQLKIKAVVYDSLNAFTESIKTITVQKPSTAVALTALDTASTGTVTTSTASSAMTLIKAITPQTQEEKAKVTEVLTTIVSSFFTEQTKVETAASETSNTATSKLSVITLSASNIQYMSNGVVSLVIQKMASTTSNIASNSGVNVEGDMIDATKKSADAFGGYIKSMGITLKRVFSKVDLQRLDQVYDNIASIQVKNVVPDMPASLIENNGTFTYTRKVNIATLNNLEVPFDGKNKVKLSSSFSSLVSDVNAVSVKTKTLNAPTVSNSVSKAIELSLMDMAAVKSSGSIAEIVFETSSTSGRSISATNLACMSYDPTTEVASSTTYCSITSSTSNSVTTSVKSTGVYIITSTKTTPTTSTTPITSTPTTPTPHKTLVLSNANRIFNSCVAFVLLALINLFLF